jgi:tetratricopeptide (TPR) repeat protein
MNNERIIKIFMASSDELEGDRAVFGNLVRRLNDLYKKRGIYIELFQWEDFDASYGSERKQEEYNEKVRESDIFLAFFHKKAGEFTVEEFDTAVTHFEQNAQPKVYTYMKDLAPDEQEDDSLKSLKERLYKDMGHFWCRYGNSDTMKLHFVLQFQLLEENRHTTRLEVKDSVVHLDDEAVVNLKNVPFAANNEAFQKLAARKEKLTEKVIRYRAKVAKDPDDPDYLRELREAIQEMDEVSKELEQHEHFLFELAKKFAQQASKACSERMIRAKELFEQGKAAEANGILDTEDLNRDITANLRRWEQDKARVEEDRKTLLLNIDECLLKTKTAMADSTLSIPDRLKQACEAYDKALELQRKLEIPQEELSGTLFGYAYLLNEFKQYKEALPLYTEAYNINRTLGATNHTYMPLVAIALHNLALLYYNIKQYSQAETRYTAVLELYHILAFINPDKYQPNIAGTLNNLALLHWTTNQYGQAETEYTEALEIYRTLAISNPDAYMPNVALALNNLAVLHYKINQYSQAKTEFVEALEIRRALGSANPDTYLPDIAQTLNNLANLHSAINQYSQAETEYAEVLEIDRTLTTANPYVYQSDVADTLNNLAVLHCKINQYSQAKTEYTEALEIYRTLAISNPDAYMPNVALALNNLAGLHYKINQYSQAETEYDEALEIRKTLAVANPDVYQSDVAATLNNLALLHSKINQYSQAETEYAEALEIRKTLTAANPDVYGIDLCETAYSYGKMLIDFGLKLEKGRQLLDDAFNFTEDLALIKLNDKWGYIDKTGNEVIPCIYDDAYSFNLELQGLALVKLNDNFHYIDTKGKRWKYEEAYGFNEDLAPVMLNGKWGYIDEDKNEVIPLKYDNACSFNQELQGMAKVKLDGKEFFIDKTGKYVKDV